MAQRWVSCRRRFLLPVRVLSELFRGSNRWRSCSTAHAGRQIASFSAVTPHSTDAQRPSPPTWRHCAGASGMSTARLRSPDPRRCLRYLSRYTHRVAISNTPADRVRPQRRHLQIQRSIAPTAVLDSKRMTLDTARVHPPLPHPCPTEAAFTASATSACSPGRPVSTTSRAPASFSPCRNAARTQTC